MGKSGIGKRLYGALGVVLAISLASFVHSSFALQRIRKTFTRDVAGNAWLLDHTRQVTLDAATMRMAMRGLSLFGMIHNQAQFENAGASFDSAAADVRSTLREMADSNLNDADRAAVESLRTAFEEWINDFPSLRQQSVGDHAAETTQAILQKLTPVMDRIQARAEQLRRESVQRQDEAMSQAEQDVDRTLWLGLALGLVLLACSAPAVLIVTRLVRALKGLVAEVRQGSRQVSSAASQISVASESLAQSASEQASSLHQTAAAVESVHEHARKAASTVGDLTATMDAAVPLASRVEASLNRMTKSMSDLTESSRKMTSVVKAIDEIAFQTNILALNAAVEAARSGEAGMGFAVVADEVRNLAQRSANAARETGTLLEGSLVLVRETSGRLNDLVTASAENSRGASRVQDLVNAVGVENHQESRGIQEVAQAIPQVEEATQRVAAGAEESAAASKELSSEAARLDDVAARLERIVAGSGFQLK